MTLNIKKQLGIKIKRLRTERGFSQEKFAETIGIATRTLCGIETGKNFLTAETLEKILTTLEITPEELFAVNHNKPVEDLKAEMIEIINSLSNRQQVETLYKITKSIIKS